MLLPGEGSHASPRVGHWPSGSRFPRMCISLIRCGFEEPRMAKRGGDRAGAGDSGPAWRQRAVSKSLHAARTRAEQRVERLLHAASELMDEKGTTDFTIQEVVDRSEQSLRSFYLYFDGK